MLVSNEEKNCRRKGNGFSIYVSIVSEVLRRFYMCFFLLFDIEEYDLLGFTLHLSMKYLKHSNIVHRDLRLCAI